MCFLYSLESSVQFGFPMLSHYIQLVTEPKFLITSLQGEGSEESESSFFEGDVPSGKRKYYCLAGDDYEIYDTDIEDVTEKEEGFIEKGGFGGKEDNIEDVFVVANDLFKNWTTPIPLWNIVKFNWQTATYGKMEYCEDEDDCFIKFKTKFPAIVLDNSLTSDAALSCGLTVSPLNDNEIDFRISFDESDDEDYTIIYNENSFSYKIIFVNNLKTDSENDNDKVNMPTFLSPKPEVSYFNDLDFFKDFENEFPAIVYNDALTSKLDLLTEPAISPQHIVEFNLKDETPLSECDEEEQNVLYFNDLFPFNVIYLDDLKSDKDNDNDKIDIDLPLGDMSVIPLPNDLVETMIWTCSSTHIVGFKRLQDILRVTAAQLQLLSDYNCWKDYADRDEIKD
ncbi:hypothetical protein Tco_1391749 [Tanacetum coccineum]